MNRIMIIGGPGSGKSTLARQLAERFSLPVIHLDAVFWRPGWVEPDRDVFNQQVLELIAQPQWIMEGNYSATWSERAERADLIIFLDIQTPLRLWRVIRRSLRFRGRPRPDLARDCPDKIDFKFYQYALEYGGRRRRRALSFLQASSHSQKGLHLRRNEAALQEVTKSL